MLTINPIHKTNTNYRFTANRCRTNFGYRLPKTAVSDIRDIKGMKCACCGHDVFTPQETDDYVKTFISGSKRALEHSRMDEYKGSPAFDFLKGLSQNEPKKTIRELLNSSLGKKKMQELNCSTQIKAGEIAAIADTITVKAPRVVQKLEKFYDFFSKEDKEILDLMMIYAEKYPKKTFAEIFAIPEIAEKHTEISQMYKKQASTQRIEIFKKLKEFSKDWPLNDVKNLRIANNDALKVMLNEYYKPDVKKACVDEIYNDFLKNCSKKRIRKKLFDILKDLPYQTPAADDFIAQCVNERTNDIDIVKRFAQQMQATFEHVQAQSRGGTDTKENGIVLCKKCNYERSNVKYSIFLKIHPEMKKNMQKQINKIITFLKHGKLEGYEDYPVEIKQTLLTQTDNIIKIKIQDYLKYREQQTLQRLKLAQASFEHDAQKTNEANKKLKDIDSKLEELMAAVKQLKKEKHRVEELRQKAEESANYLGKVVANNTNDLQQIQKLIEDDTLINQTAKPKKIK